MIDMPPRLSKDQLGQLSSEPTQNEVSYRKGAGGQELTYLEGWAVIDSMNQIFGPDGWGHHVHDIQVVSSDEQTNEHVVLGYCTIEVYLSGHTVRHTDVGIGTVRKPRSGNVKQEHFKLAYKEVATDALKRAARALGAKLGNSLYDKSHDLHKGNSGGSQKTSYTRKTSSAASSGTAASFKANPDGAPESNGPDGTYLCEICGEALKDSARYSAAQQALFSVNQDGRILHLSCRKNEGG